MSRKVDAAKYESLLVTLLEGAGFDSEDAARIAELMIENEKLGIATHGSYHLPTYVEMIKAGSMDPKGTIEIVSEGPTWATIDAHNNLGFLASDKAMKLAIKKAKEYGVAYVTVKNSSHYGTGAAYELMAAREGMASLVCSNTWKLMAVPGSKGPVIGNSPIGYGFPAGKYPPVFMDIATSAASNTKVLRAAEAGEQVPDGWIVDENGLPTNDPNGPHSLLPFGGHKGYGWAFFVEALAGLASGGCFLGQIGQDWIGHVDRKPNVCHAFLVIDLKKIMGEGVFEARMDACIEELHNSPKAVNATRIYVPGEIEADNKKLAEANGLELLDVHVMRMKKLCEERNVDMSGVFID